MPPATCGPTLEGVTKLPVKVTESSYNGTESTRAIRTKYEVRVLSTKDPG